MAEPAEIEAFSGEDGDTSWIPGHVSDAEAIAAVRRADACSAPFAELEGVGAGELRVSRGGGATPTTRPTTSAGSAAARATGGRGVDGRRAVTQQSGACASGSGQIVTSATISAAKGGRWEEPMLDYRLGCEDDDDRLVYPASADPDGRCGCGEG